MKRALRVMVLAGLALAVGGCARACGRRSGPSTTAPEPSELSEKEVLETRIWEVAPYRDELIVAGDHAIRRIAKDGSAGSTVVTYPDKSFRGLTIAFDHVIVGVLPSSHPPMVSGPGTIVALPLVADGSSVGPIELGDCTASTEFVGAPDVLYAYEGWHGVRRWGSLARAAETTIASTTSPIAGLVIDGGRALWLDAPIELEPHPPGALLEESAPDAAPGDAGTANGEVRVNFAGRPFGMVADATTIFVLADEPADASRNPTMLIAIDRRTFAQRVLARDLPTASWMALGDADLCIAELGGTAEEVLNASVLAVSKPTGAVRVAATGIMNARCVAADAKHFYVTDYAGTLWRLPIPP